jgi:hypothetical protein
VIDSALSQITGQLNEVLKRDVGSSEDLVVLSNLIEQDGSVATRVDNRLVVFLVNVERDTTARRAADSRGAGAAVASYPPVSLNLYVMVAAHFTDGNYAEALKFLSYAVAFFQSHPVLDRSTAPDLDPRIDRLVLEIENLGIQDLSNLWGVLSGHYLPSVLYKVRMVTFESGDIRRLVPRVTRPSSAGVPE